jgi:predicted AlkP superfamily phosphohydrolase/phosphomutase
LLVVGSDHGHETIARSVHVGQWLATQGLEADLKAGRIGVASQGTSALIYAAAGTRRALADLLPAMARQPWAGSILTGDALAATGLTGETLFAAVDTTRHDEPNEFGVPGTRWLVEDGEGTPDIGCGHHGGLGPSETRPFLAFIHPDFAPGEAGRATSLVDIAPTVLGFLGIRAEGMDGTPIST